MTAAPNGRSRKPNPLWRANRWLENRLFATMPEYRHFESEDDAVLAVSELDDEVEADPSFWWSVAVIIIMAIVVSEALPRLIVAVTPLGGGWISPVVSVLSIVVAVALIILLWRRGVSRRLRRKLIEHGIPICRGCGYLLRGVRAERCPECGRAVEDDLREVMRRAESSGAVANRSADAPKMD